jgi:hypothetical protein
MTSESLVARAKRALNQGAANPFARPASDPEPAAATQTAAPLSRREQCLLLDCSGSMAGPVADEWGSPSKHEAMRALLPQFGVTRRFAFSDGCAESPRLPAPDGSTNMAGAFAALKAAGIRHAVIITDGEPNDERAVLRAAAGLRLDIIYVGPPPEPPFLAALARACAGTAQSASLKQPAQIAKKVREVLMLPPGK